VQMKKRGGTPYPLMANRTANFSAPLICGAERAFLISLPWSLSLKHNMDDRFSIF